MITLVIDYRFGRVIASEHLPEGTVVLPKMVGRRVVYSFALNGERRASSVYKTLTEIATYEPPRSA